MIIELILISFGTAAFVSGLTSQYTLLTIIGLVLYVIGVTVTVVKDEEREQRLRDIEDIQDEMLTNILYVVLKDECDKADISEEEDTHDKKS